ncbi:DUF2779 domain-containing protein [Helicobacter cynogastricus]
MVKGILEDACILAYNANFEKTRLQELAGLLADTRYKFSSLF